MILSKKKIIWITADYFIDVDFLLVPYLQQMIDIDWYIIKGFKSNIHIDLSLKCKIVEMKYRAKDPRIMLDYYKLFKHIKAKQPDVIYSDFVGVPFYYPLMLNIIREIPIVHAAHNVIPYDGWPDKKLMTWYINYVFKKNNYFQFFSKHVIPYFKEHFICKSYFYCPMTIKGFGKVSTDRYLIDKTKVNLLFFGNVKQNKRLDLLIDAITDLNSSIQNKIHLTIAGKCDTPEKYIEQIGDCKCISTYFQRIPDEDIPELFTKHQYLVLPYEDVAQSGPHMIAYYYNLPVIASDIDGFKEKLIDGENGFLFRVNNVESLKDVLKKVVSMNCNDYDKLTSNLEKYVSDNFALDSVAHKYIDYFNTI